MILNPLALTEKLINKIEFSIYVKGNGWGHLAIKVSDVYETSEYLKQHGVEFTKEPSPMKNGTRILAFIKDPDGYVIELNEPLEQKN